MSNMLGTINPVIELTDLAHQAGAIVLVDAAQSVPHLPVDVQALDVDFLAFSAHKMCGPTGIGALYGKEGLLDSMPPFMGGGDMIKKVHLRDFSPNELPHKFEAGTPAIAEGIGFGAAVEFLDEIGMENIHQYEQHLVAYAMERLEEVPGVKVYGPAAEYKGGVMSFSFEGVHPHDVAQILDTMGIACPFLSRVSIPTMLPKSWTRWGSPSEQAIIVPCHCMKNSSSLLQHGLPSIYTPWKKKSIVLSKACTR
jgi:cysteine desulfurase/selenocysteine lyase